jgi:hypothetical protein
MRVIEQIRSELMVCTNLDNERTKKYREEDAYLHVH